MEVHPIYLEEKLKEVQESGRLAYRSKSMPTWCPGCGYFSIVDGLPGALNDLGIAPKDTVVVSGIGCSSRFPFFVNTYGFHTLHGRVLPVATGIKTANEALTVIAIGGDGDGFAIGGGPIPHAARRNVDITYLLFDNGIYGLTTGQTSPTSAIGFRTSTSPYENADRPLNPLLMLLSYGATWVGQAYAGRPQQLEALIREAIAHRGFSYLHILSPCVTFDKTDRTYAHLGEQVRDVPAGHDVASQGAAIALALQVGEPALGVFFRTDRPTLGDALDAAVERAGGKRPAARRRAA